MAGLEQAVQVEDIDPARAWRGQDKTQRWCIWVRQKADRAATAFNSCEGSGDEQLDRAVLLDLSDFIIRRFGGLAAGAERQQGYT